jgi:hypothetical protein
MYENITYAELKGLSEDEKANTLKELIELYPDKKQLAAKLGTAPVAIINLIRKYVEGKPVGRIKGSKNIKVEVVKPEEIKPETTQESQQEPGQEPQQEQQPGVKVKRKYNKKAKPNVVIELPKADVLEEIKPEPVNEIVNVPANNVDENSFSITVIKTVSGENAQVLLSGLANTLIKGQQYGIEVKIIEK